MKMPLVVPVLLSLSHADAWKGITVSWDRVSLVGVRLSGFLNLPHPRTELTCALADGSCGDIEAGHVCLSCLDVVTSRASSPVLPMCHEPINPGLEPGAACDISLLGDPLSALLGSHDQSVLICRCLWAAHSAQHSGKGWSFPLRDRDRTAEPAGRELLE